MKFAWFEAGLQQAQRPLGQFLQWEVLAWTGPDAEGEESDKSIGRLNQMTASVEELIKETRAHGVAYTPRRQALR